MKRELQDKIFKRFKFFHPEKGPRKTLMCFGFEVGDGWFQLIWDLCEKLEPLVDENFEVIQVKEKFGGLRFYAHGANEKIHDIIGKAEDKSYKICEHCGTKGKQTTVNGWVMSVCNKCLDRIRKERNYGSNLT